MFIPRVYLPDLDLSTTPVDEVALPAPAAHHLGTVLHKSESSPIQVFNGRGWFATAKISRVQGKLVFVAFDGTSQFDPPPALRLELVQGLATSEKMDWIIEKAVELGALAITPTRCERSVLKLEGDRAEKRLAHWRAIATAACLQSGQNWMPEVKDITSFKSALNHTSGPPLTRLLADPGAQKPLAQLLFPADGVIQCWVGPEAGFSTNEHAMLKTQGATAIKLGPRVLRTETAGLAMLAGIQTVAGDWR